MTTTIKYASLKSLHTCIALILGQILFAQEVTYNHDELDLHNDGEADDEKITIPEFVEVYEIDGPFFFGVATKFEEMARTRTSAAVRIIRMRKVSFIDATGLHNLEIFVDASVDNGRKIILSGVNENVYRSLERSGLVEKIGKENILDNIHAALDRSFDVV